MQNTHLAPFTNAATGWGCKRLPHRHHASLSGAPLGGRDRRHVAAVSLRVQPCACIRTCVASSRTTQFWPAHALALQMGARVNFQHRLTRLTRSPLGGVATISVTYDMLPEVRVASQACAAVDTARTCCTFSPTAFSSVRSVLYMSFILKPKRTTEDCVLHSSFASALPSQASSSSSDTPLSMSTP